MNDISAIIITHRNPSYLDLCLKSLTENKVLNETEIIVVADGFVDESMPILEKYKSDISILPLKENKGQNIAHNYGVFQASNDWVLILNDDQVAPRKWDKRLIGAIRENTAVTINQIEPNPSIFNSFIIKDFGPVDNFNYSQFLDYEIELKTSNINNNKITTNDGSTWPPFMPKRLFMGVGGIDTSYPVASYADHDLFTKLKIMNVTCSRYHLLHFYHFANRAEGINNKEILGAQYFNFKWGFPSTFNKDNSHTPNNQLIKGIQF